MPTDNDVFVEGFALERSQADPTRSLPELIFSCVSSALADAGCTLADVDAITIAAEDLIDGRSLSSMITGPAAGAYLRDEIRVSEDGLVALSLGCAQIQSRTFGRVVVAAWGRVSEGDPERASAIGFDPFTTQPFGVTALAVSALRASAYQRAFGAQVDHRARANDARHSRALANPRAVGSTVDPVAPFPLKPSDLRVGADVVAAVVLGPNGGSLRVTGVGHATDTYHLEDRNLSQLPSSGAAARRALDDSGRSLAEIDVVEVAGPTVWEEVELLESIGLADPGTGLRALAEDPRVNRSGGSAAGDCDPAAGLVRFVEAVHQLTGRAGANQIAGRPRTALIIAGSALSGQTHTAIVVES